MTPDRLKHEEEVFKLAWTTALAVGGGTAALIIHDPVPFRVLLISLGLIFTSLLLVFTVAKEAEIKQATEEEQQ